jgi:hypothetical protein
MVFSHGLLIVPSLCFLICHEPIFSSAGWPRPAHLSELR